MPTTDLLRSGQDRLQRYAMDILTLPGELLAFIVAEISSRRDLVNLHQPCKRFDEVVLFHREHECLKLFAILDERADSYKAVDSEIPDMLRAHPFPQPAIRSFLVGFLPSEQEALDLLHNMMRTRYSVGFEAFVLEMLYGYLRRERFLQDKGAARRLQEVYATDDT